MSEQPDLTKLSWGERAHALFPAGSNGEYDLPAELVSVFHRADGCHVWDSEEREYLDYIMAWGSALVGHAHPRVAEAVGGRASILFDSGVRGGLDIARALALGADFVLCGRAFIYGPAALGARGGDYVFELLRDDLKNNMSNLGCASIAELRELSGEPLARATPEDSSLARQGPGR